MRAEPHLPALALVGICRADPCRAWGALSLRQPAVRRRQRIPRRRCPPDAGPRGRTGWRPGASARRAEARPRSRRLFDGTVERRPFVSGRVDGLVKPLLAEPSVLRAQRTAQTSAQTRPKWRTSHQAAQRSITPRCVTQPSAINAHVLDSRVGAAVGSIELALTSALGPGRACRGRQPLLDTTQAEHAARTRHTARGARCIDRSTR